MAALRVATLLAPASPLHLPQRPSQPIIRANNVTIIQMMGINKELSTRLAQRMWVDPGDEDFGQCFFNARRALFRLTRLGMVEEARYTEGFAVYFNYRTEMHCIAAHSWVTEANQAIDVDYASYGRYQAAYFPGLHFSVDEAYQRLKNSTPPGTRSAFGLMPMGVEMATAYVQACEHLVTTWPDQVTSYDLDHLNQWRHNLAALTEDQQP